MSKRLTEEELDQQWQQHGPRIYGGLLKLFASALQHLPNVEIPEQQRPRLLDFALLGEAVHKALGIKKSFATLFNQRISGSLQESAMRSPGVQALIQVAQENWKDKEVFKFDGNYAQLLERIRGADVFILQCANVPHPAGLATSVKTHLEALTLMGFTIHWVRNQREMGQW